MCVFCGKNFNLTNHERDQAGKTPHACSVCGRSCSGKANLLRHMRNPHGGDVIFMLHLILCSLCEKHFRRRSNFMNHERIHTEENPERCPACGKSFWTKTYLDYNSG
uniref:C2H2-type domain-containing protein n=1 Tax=Micrurus spixii TaxID=129469 RepID=A0A2D4N6B9_9SAUR